jgi:hypothetical protein
LGILCYLVVLYYVNSPKIFWKIWDE